MGLLSIDEQFIGEEVLEVMEANQDLVGGELGAYAEGKKKVSDSPTGWFNYPECGGFEALSEIEEVIDRLPVDYDLVLVIGIGGSYLGTRAVDGSLNHTLLGQVPQSCSGHRPLIRYVGHHVCETELVEILDLLNHRRPIINVISKSGTTLEPGIAFRVVRDFMEKTYGVSEAKQRILVTTSPVGGALRKMASHLGYQSFEIPEDMGGRFSVLSPVGMLPLALGKIDVRKIMEGADSCFREVLSLDRSALRSHPISRYPLFRYGSFQSGKAIDLLAYSEPRLLFYAEWWKQLFGESEGKEGKGLFPASVAYTTDLHSLGQYVQDGARHLIETFLSFSEVESSYQLGVKKRLKIPMIEGDDDGLNYLQGRFLDEVNQSAVRATRLAHFTGGVPNVELRVSVLNEHSLGFLFAFFQTACALSAGLLKLNPFDQPGVEAYKKNLFDLLGKPS